MRMMLRVQIPAETGNKTIKDGSLPKTMMRFIENFKPEGSYFVAEGGMRTAYFFFDMKDPTMIPSVAEPFFMTFGADIHIVPAMNAEDMRAGVDRAMKNP